MNKIQISRVDASGFYVEPILVTQSEIDRHVDVDDEFTLGDVVIDKVQEGLHTPQFDGTSWVEGKPSTEILTLVKEQKINEIKNIAGQKIGEVAPIWKQVNILRAKGKTATEFKEIDAIRTKSDDLEVQVNNATTVEEVENVTW